MNQENHGRCQGRRSELPIPSSRIGRSEATASAMATAAPMGVTLPQEAAKCADDSNGHNPDIPDQWTVFHQMNHREPPHPSAAMRRALLRLSLLLSTAGTLPSAHAMPRLPVITFSDRVAEATPYLRFNGAPPLRFAQAPAPAKAQGVPSPTAATSAPAATETSATTADANPAPAAGTTSAALTEALTEGAAASAKNPDTPARKSPAPILQDEMRPTVRAEDFLPFFQIPASARKPGDVTLIVPGIPTPPAPGTLQPSSATYTQSPK